MIIHLVESHLSNPQHRAPTASVRRILAGSEIWEMPRLRGKSLRSLSDLIDFDSLSAAFVDIVSNTSSTARMVKSASSMFDLFTVFGYCPLACIPHHVRASLVEAALLLDGRSTGQSRTNIREWLYRAVNETDTFGSLVCAGGRFDKWVLSLTLLRLAIRRS